jgi:hypothetical protein
LRERVKNSVAEAFFLHAVFYIHVAACQFPIWGLTSRGASVLQTFEMVSALASLMDALP